MITQTELKELLNYNKETGLFTWKKRVANRIKVGDVAGYKLNTGYIIISINKKYCLAHRLAWLYEYGIIPIKDIDHINGIKDDNRISNLREVTCSQNSWNYKKPKTNKSGFKGVCFNKSTGKWMAQISYQNKHKYLGLYYTPEEAAEAYKQAAKKYHGQFARMQ